ncbi:hypothetical protein [Chryseobacterium bernardetii]|uniref:hypothetical protein n=1 Tax=Chryseobacterium bernardetii TaxID=1241978 RepID=UPI003AF97F4F
MSRMRIVKGTYTKISQEGHSMYSNENIITTAGAAITETGASDGVSYGNPSKPPAGKVVAKCMVKFRPHDKYKDNPDFGFDWLREGDSGQLGDNWFGAVMGKYYEADNVTVFKNGNSWNTNFHKDPNMYDKKLKSYKSLSISWKKINKKPYLYPIPVLALLKGKSALLTLKIEIKEKPQKLTFEFKDKDAEKYLSLNLKEIGVIKVGKYDKSNYLKITCKEQFSKEQMLYVKADGEICGALIIHPNSSAHVKKISALFISVKTDINDVIKVGKAKPGSQQYFTECLNQALVSPTIQNSFSIDCTGNFLYNAFRSKFCKKIDGKYYIHNSSGLKDYLEEKFRDKYGSQYDSHFKVFFIEDIYPGWKNGKIASYTNGFSYFNTTFTVQFYTHSKETVAHELMHALGLPHTFDGNAPAKYTYEAYKTNNLMDYCHHIQIPRISVFKWQWKVLNSKIML